MNGFRYTLCLTCFALALSSIARANFFQPVTNYLIADSTSTVYQDAAGLLDRNGVTFYSGGVGVYGEPAGELYGALVWGAILAPIVLTAKAVKEVRKAFETKNKKAQPPKKYDKPKKSGELPADPQTHYENGLPPTLPPSDRGEALYRLALAHAHGLNVPKDYAQAATLFRRAAEQGHVRAQFNLGQLYDFGEGVPENQRQALYWYDQAAKQGHAPAQYALGYAYHFGRGSSTNYSAAFFWWSLAAAAEYLDAIQRRDEVAKHFTNEQLSVLQQHIDAWFQQQIHAPG